MKSRKQLTIVIIIILAVVIIVYAFFNSRLLIAGPQITIKSPQNGSAFEAPLIELIGIAKNTSFISLDGNPIYVDESGNFSEKLLLAPGTSIITLSGRDRFDREAEVTLWYHYTGDVEETTPTLPALDTDLAHLLATTTATATSSFSTSTTENSLEFE